ncbi:MAG: hypothetical protein HFF90_10025 [Oscillibacter sp.]|nr:hypothetical protein [Oscillibacter sp.]
MQDQPGLCADVWTLDIGYDGLLAIVRYFEGQKISGVFNFMPKDKTVAFPHADR